MILGQAEGNGHEVEWVSLIGMTFAELQRIDRGRPIFLKQHDALRDHSLFIFKSNNGKVPPEYEPMLENDPIIVLGFSLEFLQKLLYMRTVTLKSHSKQVSVAIFIIVGNNDIELKKEFEENLGDVMTFKMKKVY